jgi:hypothetical protein
MSYWPWEIRERSIFVFAGGQAENHPSAMFLDVQNYMPQRVSGNGWPLPADLKFRRIADDGGDAVYMQEMSKETACSRGLDCGGWCWQPPGHAGPCLCCGDEDGEPDTCPA